MRKCRIKQTKSASSSKFREGSTDIFPVWIFKISIRPPLSGGPTYKIRSSRPGRINAVSYQEGSESGEYARAYKGAYNHVWSVCCCDDGNTCKILYAIHFVEQSSEDSFAPVTRISTHSRCSKCVDLILRCVKHIGRTCKSE